MSFLKRLFGGRTPEQELVSLSEQTMKLFQQGEYDQALAAAQKAVTLSRQHLGENHPHYALSLDFLALTYANLGDYDQAELTLKAKYDDPRYWGAFICQGEPGPLRDRD